MKFHFDFETNAVDQLGDLNKHDNEYRRNHEENNEFSYSKSTFEENLNEKRKEENSFSVSTRKNERKSDRTLNIEKKCSTNRRVMIIRCDTFV